MFKKNKLKLKKCKQTLILSFVSIKRSAYLWGNVTDSKSYKKNVTDNNK